MSAQERELRSRLAQLLTRAAIVRGSLSVREKSCGKPTCRCARGEKHRAVYLVASEEGKLRQLFIPRSLEADARECVEAQGGTLDVYSLTGRRSTACRRW